MSNRDRVLEFLQSISPSDVSNSEIVSRTMIKPHQQVFSITRDLMKNGRISGRMVGNEWRFSAAQMDRGVAQTLRPNAVSVILKPQVSQPQDASGPGAKELHLTWNELQYCADIRNRDESLRAFLLQEDLANPPDIRAWLAYLTNMKRILGNLNNCVGFAATLLAKEYLAARFNVTDFDAAAKAQGAPGPDIEVRSSDGKLIRCELKTTHPYQQGLGAKQKEEILKDLKKLVESSADHKLMMVIDNERFLRFASPHIPLAPIQWKS